jgi:hypothetical protein
VVAEDVSVLLSCFDWFWQEAASTKPESAIIHIKFFMITQFEA